VYLIFNVDMGTTVQRLDYNSVKSQNFNQGLLLGVEDTGYVTTELRLTNLLFLLLSLFFCPFVPYCFTSAVSSTPTRSPIKGIVVL